MMIFWLDLEVSGLEDATAGLPLVDNADSDGFDDVLAGFNNRVTELEIDTVEVADEDLPSR